MKKFPKIRKKLLNQIQPNLNSILQVVNLKQHLHLRLLISRKKQIQRDYIKNYLKRKIKRNKDQRPQKIQKVRHQ